MINNKNFTTVFLIAPANHSTADKIPLTRVGRRLYTVRHRVSGVERSIVCQVDGVEGSKKITIRSPVQVQNDPSFSWVHISHIFVLIKKINKANYYQKNTNCNRNTINIKKKNHYQ